MSKKNDKQDRADGIAEIIGWLKDGAKAYDKKTKTYRALYYVKSYVTSNSTDEATYFRDEIRAMIVDDKMEKKLSNTALVLMAAANAHIHRVGGDILSRIMTMVQENGMRLKDSAGDIPVVSSKIVGDEQQVRDRDMPGYA